MTSRAKAGRLDGDHWARRLMITATVMVALLLIMAVTVSTIRPAGAEESARSAAIQQVIADQLAAFSADDGERAFAHAAPTIQRMFGSPEIFMSMVKQGYRPVYRPRGYRFIAFEDEGEQVFQNVLLTGPDGALTIARYSLIQIDGVWRINSCTLLKPGEGV